MILADMSARKRHDTLWLTLEFVLQDLVSATDTATVCDALALRLRSGEKAVIARWLMKVAALVPEASHTGDTFMRAGQTRTRWIWRPRGSGSPAVSPAPALDEERAEQEKRQRIIARLEARDRALAPDLQAANVNVDDQDW